MSSTAMSWLFGGWSFGRSSDDASGNHHRPKRSEYQRIQECTADADTGHTEDVRLVAQVRAGDPSALDTLFLRYYAPLVEFAASYVGSMDDGEEVVADVLARLWVHRATWTAPAGVSAYLFRAVRNRALDVVRFRTREHRRTTMFRVVGEAPGTAAPSRDFAEQVERDEYAAIASRLMARLPERQRLILSLRWNYTLAWDEIATVLGVTSAAVRTEHSRILATLRAELRAL